MRTLIAGAMLAAALLLGCDGSPPAGGGGAPAGPTLRVAVIPKGTTHVYWRSVEAGARQAAEELGIEMVWKGPLKENDRAQQIAIVEQFVSEGVSGIVLAPLDDTALRAPVQSAAERKVPVVIFDSALKGEVGTDFVSYVGTNNKQGGMIAGEELARLLGNKGKVVLLRYLEGSASTTEREAGFLEVMARHPEIQVIVDNRFAGATTGEAKTAAMNLLDRLKEADGVFAPNEPSVAGMLLALRESGLTKKVKFVGFDAAPQLLDALRAGDIHALVVQNPRKMGYQGLKTLAAHIKGETVSPNVDTGVDLVTRENMDTPPMKKLLGKD